MQGERLRETIASAQAGSADAYRALLRVYGPRLYGYFYRATRNHHDAEDLLGEISLRLVRRLKTYDERGRFDPWLFRIAANMVRDRIRRIKTAPSALSFSFGDDESGASPIDRIADDAAPVDAAALAAEASGALQDALAKLDEPTREVILLRHFGGMSYKEIAEVCGCPLGTVLARVHRGLKKLRVIMDT